MKRLKFTQDEGSLFYKELVQRIDQYFAENQLEKTGNGLFKAKMLMYFASVALFYGLMVTAQSLAAFYAFYLLMGLVVLLTAFNVSHDAAHGVAVKSKFWNKILFQISFNLQGNNAYVWGKNHNESHHLYTNVEGSDIDVLNNPLFRMTETQPLKWFHKYQLYYAPVLYLLYSLNWFFFRETLMLFNISSRTMIVLPIYLLPFGAGHVLLAFLANHFMVSIIFVGVLGVSHVSDYVEHPLPDAQGKLNMSWPMLQMRTSVDYNSDSAFFNWTLGGFNAHALHHLLPNICHVHYLNILPIFREVAQKHGITYLEMSYWASLQAHFRFLKKMGSSTTIQRVTYERNPSFGH